MNSQSFSLLLIILNLLIQISVQDKTSVCLRNTDRIYQHCSGQFGIMCGKYCATDLKACNQFRNMFEISLLKVIFMPALFHLELSKYKETMKKIHQCTTQSYNWTSKDVCRLKETCYLVELLTVGKISEKYVTKTACRCEQPIDFKCQNNNKKAVCGKH